MFVALSDFGEAAFRVLLAVQFAPLQYGCGVSEWSIGMKKVRDQREVFGWVGDSEDGGKCSQTGEES